VRPSRASNPIRSLHPRRADLGRVVEVARLLRDRQELLVDQVLHPALDEVDVGDQAVDRMRPRVVLLVTLHEGEHPEQAPALLALDAERPGRQRARADQVELGDAAAGHGRPPAAVGLDDLVDRDQVLEQDRRLPVAGGVELGGGVDRAAGERRHDVGCRAGGGVEQDGPHPPLDGPAGPEGEHLALGWLLEPEVGEAGVLADQPVGGEQRACPADLVGAESLQGMGWLGPARGVGSLGLGSYGHGNSGRAGRFGRQRHCRASPPTAGRPEDEVARART
jgi:hypothetical protein